MPRRVAGSLWNRDAARQHGQIQNGAGIHKYQRLADYSPYIRLHCTVRTVDGAEVTDRMTLPRRSPA
jgi:hypothetical protein